MKRLTLLLLAICSFANLENTATAQDFGGIFRDAMESSSEAYSGVSNAYAETIAVTGTYSSRLSEAMKYGRDADAYTRKAYFMPDYSHMTAEHMTRWWRFNRDDADLCYRWLVSYIESSQRSSRVLDEALAAAWNAKQKTETAYQLALLYEQYNLVYNYVR